MITKEMFTKILTQIKNDDDNMKKLNYIFRTMKNDFIDGEAFINPQLTGLIIEMLDSQFGEDCDWVAYWVYELEYGTCNNGFVTDFDGNTIHLETIDELWDFLVEQFGER